MAYASVAADAAAAVAVALWTLYIYESGGLPFAVCRMSFIVFLSEPFQWLTVFNKTHNARRTEGTQHSSKMHHIPLLFSCHFPCRFYEYLSLKINFISLFSTVTWLVCTQYSHTNKYKSNILEIETCREANLSKSLSLWFIRCMRFFYFGWYRDKQFSLYNI